MKDYKVTIKIPAECRADLNEVLESYEQEHPLEVIKIRQVSR